MKLLKFIFFFIFSANVLVGNAQLNASFTSPDVDQCPSNLFTVNATNTSYSTYNWTITGPSPSVSVVYSGPGSSASVFLTASGQYNVTLSVSNGGPVTTNTQSNYLTVFQVPSINYVVTPASPVCSNQPISFNGSCTPGSGSLLSFSTNVNDGTPSPYTTEDFIHTFTNTTSGNLSYSPSVTVTNSVGCSNTQSLPAITIKPHATLSSSLTPPAICSGQTFSYTPTSASGVTFSWSRASIAGINSGTTGSGSGNINEILTNSTASNITVTYAVTSTLNGCSYTQNVQVLVRALPVVSLNPSTLNLCTGQTGTLTASTSATGGTYVWTVPSGVTNPGNSPTLSTGIAGTYSVQYNSSPCASAPASVIVSVTVPPSNLGVSISVSENSGNSVNDGIICLGDQVILTATPTQLGGTFSWTPSGLTTASITQNTSLNTTYYVYYSIGGCTVSNNYQVVVKRKPNISYLVSSTFACGPPVTVTYTSTSTLLTGHGTIVSNSWNYPSGNLISSINTPATANSINVSYSSSGVYGITLTSTSSFGCSNTTNFNNVFTVGNSIPPSGNFIVNNPIQCAYVGSTQNNFCFTYTGGNADSLVWDWGDGTSNTITNGMPGPYCHSYADIGNYVVTLYPFTTSPTRCAGNLETITINVIGPKADGSEIVTNTTSFCNDQRIRQFTASTIGNDPGTSYSWQFVNPNSTVSGVTANHTFSTFSNCTSSGISIPYDVVLTTTYAGCSDIDTVKVVCIPNNQASFEVYNCPPPGPSCIPTTNFCENSIAYVRSTTPCPQFTSNPTWDWNYTNSINFPTGPSGSSININLSPQNLGLSSGNQSWIVGTIYTIAMSNRSINFLDANINYITCEQIVTRQITINGISPNLTLADTICAGVLVQAVDNSIALPTTTNSIASKVWTSSNTSIVTVSSTGMVTGVSAGTANIILTITDAAGCQKVITKTITVRKPTANFTVNKTILCSNEPMIVTNTSTGLGLSSSSYVWTSTGTPSSATWSSGGTFTFTSNGSVTLTVTDNLGCTDSKSVNVTIQNLVLSASMSPNPAVFECFSSGSNSVDFTSNSTPGASHYWNIPSVPLVSTLQNPTFSISTPGVHNVYLTVSSGTYCSVGPQLVGTITINGPFATIDVTNSNLTGCSCYNANISVATSNVSTAKLFYQDGSSLSLTPNTTQNISHSYCNNGINPVSYVPFVYVEGPGQTCNGAINSLETITVIPSPAITPMTKTVCSGVSFTSTPTNVTDGLVPTGTTYSWSLPVVTGGMTGGSSGTGATSITGTLINPTNTPQTATYTVTATSGTVPNQCSSTFTLTVTVNPTPAVTSMTNSACSGSSFTSTPANVTNGVVPAGTTYSWSGPVVTGGITGGSSGTGATSITGTLTNPTNSVQTATYTVTPTSGTCSGASFTLTVTINPRPAITTMTNTVCSGSSFTSTPTNVTNGLVPAGTTYSWSTPLVTGGMTGGSSGTGATSITGTLTNPTNSAQTATYTVTPTSGTCSGASFTLTVTVNPGPAITTMANSACSGSSFTSTPANLTNGVVPAGTTYSWSAPVVTGGMTGGSSGTAATSITGTLTNPTNSAQTATYTVTPTSGTCSGASFTLTVTVNPRPAITSMTNIVCSGLLFTSTPVNVTNGLVPAGTTYSWSTPVVTGGMTGGSSGIGASSVTGTLTNPTNSAQTATYTVTPTSGTCSGASFTLTVTVNPLPTFTTSTLNPSLCGSNNGSITLSGLNSTSSYVLNYLDDGNLVGPISINNPVGGVYLIPGLNAGGYSNIIINDGTCNSNAANLSLSDPSAPIFSVSQLTNPTTCGGFQGSIHIEGSGNLSSNALYTLGYTYNGVGVGPVNITTDNNGDYDILGLAAGTYTSFNLSIGSCSSSQPGPIQLTNPSGPTVSNQSITALCSDVAVGVSFGASTGVSASTYNVTGLNLNGLTVSAGGASVGNGLLSTDLIDDAFTNTTNAVVNVVYTVVPVSSAGCLGNSFTVTVPVNPEPLVSNQSITALCSDVAVGVSFGASTGVSASTYNVTGLNLNGLTVSAGGASVGNGLLSTDLTDDAFTNTTNAVVNVVYTVIPVSSAGCLGNSFTVTVPVNPEFVLNTQSFPTSVCSNIPLNIALPNSTSISYSWFASDNINTSGESTTVQTSSLINDAILNNTTTNQSVAYEITPTSTLTGCVGNTYSYSVDVRPVATVAPQSNQTVCIPNSTAAVIFNGTIPGTIFNWTNSQPSIGLASLGSGNISSFTPPNSIVSLATATITVTPTYQGCSGTPMSFDYNVIPILTVNQQQNDTLCGGQVYNGAVFTGNVPGIIYIWQNNNSSISLPGLGSGDIAPFTVYNNGTIIQDATISVTPTYTGCPNGSPMLFHIVVKPVPNVSVTTTSQNVCHNNSTQLVDFTGNLDGFATYNWTHDNISIGLGTPGFNDIPPFTATNTDCIPQTANFTVVGSYNGCVGSPANFTITVNPVPDIAPIANQQLCGNSSTTPINFASQNCVVGGTFSWTNTEPGIGLPSVGSGNISSIVVPDSVQNPIVAQFVVTPSLNGCNGAPELFNITVLPVPLVYPIPNQGGCSGTSSTAVTFNGSHDPTAIYIWDNDDPSVGISGAGGTTGNLPSFNLVGQTNTTVISTFTVTPQLTTLGQVCSGIPQTFTISAVDPIPNIYPIADTVLCSGEQLNQYVFSGTFSNSNVTYTWQNNELASGLASNGVNIIPTQILINNTLSDIVSQIVVTPSDGFCSGATESFSITVKPRPDLFLSQTYDSLCAGNLTDLFQFSSSLAGTTYSWVGDNNVGHPTNSASGSTIQPFIGVNSGVTPLTDSIFVSSFNNGCSGDIDTLTITVNPNAQVSTSFQNYEFCSGQTINIPFNGSVAGATYSWSNSNTSTNIPFNGTGGALNVTVSNTSLLNQTSTITVIPSFNGCPGQPYLFTVKVKPLPNIIPAINDITLCANTNTPLIDFLGDYDDSTNFNWYNSNNSIGANGSLTTNGIGDILPFLTANSSGITQIDSFIVTPELNGCFGTPDTFLITVYPVTQVITSDISVCSGTLIPTTCFTGSVPGVIYNWSSNNVGIGMDGTGIDCIPSFTAITGTAPQTATITVTPIYNGCTGIVNTMQIEVRPVPIMNSNPDLTYCDNEFADSVYFSSNISSNYLWTNNNISIGLGSNGDGNLDSYIASNEFLPEQLVQNAEIVVTPNAYGCTGLNDTFNITVHPLPQVFAGIDTFLCFNQCLTLNANGTALTYIWDNGGLQGQQYCPTSSIMMHVTGTDANQCQNTDSFFIEYSTDLPPIVSAGPDSAICFGESYTLTAVGNADLYDWNNQVFDGEPFTPNQTNTYVVIATDISNGCISSDTMELVVHPLPIVTANTLDSVLCEGEQALLWGEGAMTYVWNNGITDSVWFTPIVSDTYTVIGYDQYGCTDTVDISMVVNPLPQVLFSTDMNYGGCLEFCPTFTDLSNPPSESVQWNFGNSTFSNELGSVLACYNNYGCYDVTLISTTAEGCTDSLTQQNFVCVNEIIASFNPDVTEQLISNPIFEFTNTSINATSYQWFFGDNTESDFVNTIHTYDSIGYYQVVLVAYAQDGCSDTAVVVVKVNDQLIIYVPNAFTPDGDQLNDVFLPILTAGYMPGTYEFAIYNRWGERFFYTEDVNEGWDGTFKGNDAQIGTYTYTIKFKDSMNNKVYSYNGRVSLIR